MIYRNVLKFSLKSSLQSTLIYRVIRGGWYLRNLRKMGRRIVLEIWLLLKENYFANLEIFQ